MICCKHEEKRRHIFNAVPTLHRLLVRYPEVRQLTFAEKNSFVRMWRFLFRARQNNALHSQSSFRSRRGLSSNTGCQAAILRNTSVMGSVYRLGLNTVVARTQERNT
ncbi:hypothetical protein AVEN_226789-1 [Araneus ventricosus]|uniref:Uncharacterized protein n=1 Tax=Araneus ventricosus TaxID=182803 RepID=A0A4Y2QD80_ARAVE|nr:hypothetical protein AVEN_226789-1 [Araneus ventricosus]